MTGNIVLLSALLLGLMLLFAVAGAYAARRVHFPRVVGFLVAGLLLKIALQLFVTYALGDPHFFEQGSDQAGEAALELFKLINHLALGLIMFTIGTVFEVHHLRSVGKRFWPLVLGDSGLTFVLVAGACTLVALLSGQIAHPLMLGLMAGVVAMATAPAATLFVMMEYESKGPTTNHILSMVGANNVLSIVMFNVALLAFVGFGWLTRGTYAHPVVDMLMLTAGSLVVGAVLGLAFAWVYPRLATSQSLLLFLAIFLFLPVLQNHYHVNALVAALIVGIVFINMAPDPTRLERQIESLGGPLFAIFFVLAGFNLHLGEFTKVTMLGVIVTYVVARAAGKVLGGYGGIRSGRIDPAVRPTIGWGLLCQAGVAIGLAGFLVDHTAGASDEIRQWAKQIQTIVLASVAIFELAGPLLLKRVIVGAGEVKAIHLLARHPVGPDESVTGASWLSALGSILRRLNIAPSAVRPEGKLVARHIMRTNVKMLPAAADLDEVLHFIERSRLDHFPVVAEDGRLIGTINLADVRDIIYNPDMRQLVTAADLIEPELITATADEPLDDLFEKFEREKIFAMPVVDSADARKLIGLVEQRDLLRALHSQVVGDKEENGGH